MDVDEQATSGHAAATEETTPCELDCYPYTFSPLLLFAESSYFDKGYSNYNAVAQFFAPALDVNMLENVLFERKNMLYEELLQHVLTNKMLVTCCIGEHFTALQVIPPPFQNIVIHSRVVVVAPPFSRTYDRTVMADTINAPYNETSL